MVPVTAIFEKNKIDDVCCSELDDIQNLLANLLVPTIERDLTYAYLTYQSCIAPYVQLHSEVISWIQIHKGMVPQNPLLHGNSFSIYILPEIASYVENVIGKKQQNATHKESVEGLCKYIAKSYNDHVWFTVPRKEKTGQKGISKFIHCHCSICLAGGIPLEIIDVYDWYIEEKYKSKTKQYTFFDKVVTHQTILDFDDCYDYIVKPFVNKLEYICEHSNFCPCHLHTEEEICETNLPEFPLMHSIGEIICCSPLHREGIASFIKYHVDAQDWIRAHQGSKPKRFYQAGNPYECYFMPLLRSQLHHYM